MVELVQAQLVDSQLPAAPANSFSPQVAALDNQIRVTTPENIAFHYQVAGPFRRLLAYGLDVLLAQIGYGLLVLLIMFLFSMVLIPLTAVMGGGAAIVEAVFGILGGMVQVGAFLTMWFYGALTETYFNGQSVGKMLANLRVLSADGSAINAGQAVLRNFFRLLDLAPFITVGFVFGIEDADFYLPTFLVGLTVMTVSRRYQRIGDLVAKTMVVSEEKWRAPELIRLDDSRVVQLAELIPAHFEFTASLAKTLAHYVERRRHLPYARVSEIARHLAAPLIVRFQLLSDTNHDLLLCAMYYRAFVADRAPSDEPELVDQSTDTMPHESG